MKSIFYLCFFILLNVHASDDENQILEKTHQNLEAFLNLTTNQILTMGKTQYENLQINLCQDICDLKQWYVSLMQLRETFWCDEIQKQEYNEAVEKLKRETGNLSNDKIREAFYQIYNITENTQINEKMQEYIVEKFIEMNIFQLKENLIHLEKNNFPTFQNFAILFDSIFYYLNDIINQKFGEKHKQVQELIQFYNQILHLDEKIEKATSHYNFKKTYLSSKYKLNFVILGLNPWKSEANVLCNTLYFYDVSSAIILTKKFPSFIQKISEARYFFEKKYKKYYDQCRWFQKRKIFLMAYRLKKMKFSFLKI